MIQDHILEGKCILVVDDDIDIVETISELLDMCRVDAAVNFESAKGLLLNEVYDAAIFDIMGVSGFELLSIARSNNIPSLMLTAHSFSPESLTKSLKKGAYAYLPKDKLFEVDRYLAEMVSVSREGSSPTKNWFSELKPYFDKKFGGGWRKTDEGFWSEYESL